jgi:lipid-A-disaccharide synthase
MVVAYRLGAVTAFLLQRLGLVKVQHFSQPNLLSGREVVPEFFQAAATPEALGAALLGWLDSPARLPPLQAAFDEIHERLRCGGAGLAADAVIELLAR